MAASEVRKRVAAHRAELRKRGLRPIQIWVPDTRAPEFAAQLRQQCQNLNGDPADAEVLRFTAEAATQIEGWA